MSVPRIYSDIWNYKFYNLWVCGEAKRMRKLNRLRVLRFFSPCRLLGSGRYCDDIRQINRNKNLWERRKFLP